MFYSELSHSGKDFKNSIVLGALAQREEGNRTGKMTVSWSVACVGTCTCRSSTSMLSLASLLLFFVDNAFGVCTCTCACVFSPVNWPQIHSVIDYFMLHRYVLVYVRSSIEVP